MPEFQHHANWLRAIEDRLAEGRPLDEKERTEAVGTCEWVLGQNPASQMAAGILAQLRGVMAPAPERYEPLTNPLEAPEVLRPLYDAGINDIFARISERPVAGEDPALASLRTLRDFRRNRTGWAALEGDEIICIDPGVAGNAWLVVLPHDHPVNRSQETLMAVDTQSPLNYLKIKPSAVSRQWAGLAKLHEMRHLHDFTTGLEPKRPNRQQYIAGEVRAYSDEITAANLLSEGRLPTAIDDAIARHGVTTMEHALALRQNFAAISGIAREIDPCITPQLPLSQNESGTRLGFYMFAIAFRIADRVGGDRQANRTLAVERLYGEQGLLPHA